MLKDQIATDPALAERALKKLSGIHFTVSINSNGLTKVTHQTDFAPDNETVAEGFNQIYSGMDQTMAGFYTTWSLFMLSSPFPEVSSDYQLENMSNGYRLSYKDGSAAVVIIMAKDLAITSLTVVAPNFTSVINPNFTKNPKGFVLSSYDGIYKGSDGTTEDTILKVQIKYKEVDGLLLPSTLNLSGSYGGASFDQEISFSNYRLMNR